MPYECCTALIGQKLIRGGQASYSLRQKGRKNGYNILVEAAAVGPVGGQPGAFKLRVKFSTALSDSHLLDNQISTVRIFLGSHFSLNNQHSLISRDIRVLFRLLSWLQLRSLVSLVQLNKNQYGPHQGKCHDWHHWFGRHGQDVCPAAQSRRVEVNHHFSILTTIICL